MTSRSFVLALAAVLMFASYAIALATPAPSGVRFEISFPKSVHPQPITGRMLLMISRKNEPEVRLQGAWVNSPPLYSG
jgi:hypothetical protein